MTNTMMDYTAANSNQIYQSQKAIRKMEDYGRSGKAFEIAIKNIIAPTASNKRNNKVTPNGEYTKGDIISRRKVFDGKARIEIKSACGELGAIETQDELERFENGDYTMLLKGADYVIYCPEVLDNYHIEDLAIIAPRDEFLNVIMEYTGSGKPLKINKGRGRYMVNIQSFHGTNCRPKASRRLAELYSDTMYDTFPTVAEFFGIKSGSTKQELMDEIRGKRGK